MEHEIKHILNKVNGEVRLPALSSNFNVLMHTLADNEISLQKLASVIRNYPEITARLIALANSAWSAPVKPVTNIENACFRLGTSVVTSVWIALTVSYHFNPFRCPGFDLEKFWATSLLVAEGGRLLASALPNGNARDELIKTAQTAGMLHNLGLLWLAENLPEETGAALRMATSEPALTVSQSLFECVGADYCEVGGWLGNQWLLPEILVVAMSHHQEADYQGRYWEIARLIGMAAEMAGASFKNIGYVPETDCLEKLGLSLLSLNKISQRLADNLDNTRDLVRTLFG